MNLYQLTFFFIAFAKYVYACTDSEQKGCHYSCASCNPGRPCTCTSCNGGLNRYADMTISAKYRQCPCKPHYYEKNGQQLCYPCEHPCVQCQGDAHKCTECETAGHRQDFAVNYGCPCVAGYFEIKGQVDCVKCHPSCLECDGNAKTCTKCLIYGTERLDNSMNFECPCKPGFYEANQENCQACNYSKCVECSRSAEFCTKCQPDQILESNTCKDCGIGQYGFGSICLDCHYSCAKCENESNECHQCYDPQTSFRQDLSQSPPFRCPCQIGYYDAKQTNCKPCKKFCYDCERTSNYCTKCDTNGTNREDLSNTLRKCPCKKGFYQDEAIRNYQCVVCPFPCKSCEGPNKEEQCSQCLDNYKLEPVRVFIEKTLGKCVIDQKSQGKHCEDGLYFDETKRRCLPCSWMCITCFDDAFKCRVCSIGLILNGFEKPKNCVCKLGFILIGRDCFPACTKPGQFFDLLTKDCLSCNKIPNCQLCILNEYLLDSFRPECTLCDFGFKVNSIDGLCKNIDQNDINSADIQCSENQFTIFNAHLASCITCPFGCMGCVLDSNDLNTEMQKAYRPSCSGCSKNYTLKNDLCMSNSMKCEVGCNKCRKFEVDFLNGRIEVQVCIDCEIGYQLQNYICLLQCSTNQRSKYNANICVDCSPECENCYSNIEKCPTNSQTFCPQGSARYDGHEMNHCIYCPNDCKSCSFKNPADFFSLSNCQSGLEFIDCGKNEFIFYNLIPQCVECVLPYCSKCSSEVTCLQCELGAKKTEQKLCFPIVESQEISICPKGFYDNYEVCQNCPPYCYKCLNGICKQCEPGYILDGVYCQKPFYQLPIPPSLAFGCKIGQYWDKKRCRPCNIFKSKGWCMECTNASPYECIRCSIGFFVQDGFCKECAAECEECESEWFCLRCSSTFYREVTYIRNMNRVESKCVKFCTQGLPVLASQITENLKNRQYKIGIQEIYQLLAVHQEVMDRIPSSKNHDLLEKTNKIPFGITSNQQAIYPEDGLLIETFQIEEIFDLKGSKSINQTMICLECLYRCKQCREDRRLYAQEQRCVDNCEFPFYEGQQLCEKYSFYEKFAINHESRMKLPFNDVNVSFQSTKDTLNLRAEWDGTPLFRIKWNLFTLDPLLKQIRSQYVLDEFTFVNNSVELKGYLQNIDQTLLEFKIPSSYLQVNRVYLIKMDILTDKAQYQKQQMIHCLDEYVQEGMDYFEKLFIVDKYVPQNDNLTFFFSNLISKKEKKYVRLLKYIDDIQLEWSLTFELIDNYNFGFIKLPYLGGNNTLIQIDLITPYTIYSDFFIQQQTNVSNLRNFSFFDSNQLLNDNQLTAENIKIDINILAQSILLMRTEQNKTILENQILVNSLALLLLIKTNESYQIHHYHKVGTLISLFHTMLFFEKYSYTQIIYLMEIMQQFSTISIDQFNPRSFHNVTFGKKYHENLGDFGLFLRCLVRLNHLVNFYSSRTKALKKFIQEQFLMKVIILQGQAIQKSVTGNIVIQGVLRGNWTKIDNKNMMNTNITYYHIYDKILPDVYIPLSALVFTSYELTAIVSCFNFTMASVYLQQSKPVSDVCSVQFYDTSKMNIKLIQVSFPLIIKIPIIQEQLQQNSSLECWNIRFYDNNPSKDDCQSTGIESGGPFKQQVVCECFSAAIEWLVAVDVSNYMIDLSQVTNNVSIENISEIKIELTNIFVGFNNQTKSIGRIMLPFLAFILLIQF